ncbi:MAG: Hpt domain-containing protein [Magnetospirillum sp.]|nr:Hpt domain-containing protein [Magnetospirillum sp.]
MPDRAVPPPIMDRTYLDDVRACVGDAAMTELLMAAPTYLRLEHEAVAAAWRSNDPAEVQAAAHRLKGVAGSIGASGVVRWAVLLECIDSLDDPSPLAALDTAMAEALAAVAGMT